jgi:hypothetical protein
MVERNRQVAQMAGIYSQAERVLVWLGKEEIDQKALKFMSILFRTTEDEKDWETRQRYEKDSPVQLVPVSTGLASLTADTRWLYLDHLCRQEYWSRLWIIQEFLLAKEIHFGQMDYIRSHLLRSCRYTAEVSTELGRYDTTRHGTKSSCAAQSSKT